MCQAGDCDHPAQVELHRKHEEKEVEEYHIMYMDSDVEKELLLILIIVWYSYFLHYHIGSETEFRTFSTVNIFHKTVNKLTKSDNNRSQIDYASLVMISWFHSREPAVLNNKPESWEC